MRAAVLDINEAGRWEPCDRKRPPCQLFSNMKNTSTLKSKDSNKVCQIKKNFNCNAKIVAYLIECGVSGKQCNVLLWENFVLEPVTIKAHIIFRKNKNCQIKPLRFHKHYLQNDYNGICDLEVTIIDHAETDKSLTQKELYWYQTLRIYASFDLNNCVMFILNIRQGKLILVSM